MTGSLQVGDRLPTLVKPAITTRQLVEYAGASGDFNRIHYDEPFARQGGYPQVIAHGMLSMAFVGQLVTDWLGGPRDLVRLAVRFRAVTFPGDVLRCDGVVSAINEDAASRRVDLDVTVHNQADRLTLSGSATVLLACSSH